MMKLVIDVLHFYYTNVYHGGVSFHSL